MARYVAAALADPRDRLPYATLAADGTVLGSTRFLNLEYWRWPQERRPRPADEPDAAEIGATWLTGPARRTGVNREAKLLMLTLAFEQWQLSRVNLRTDARNTRSRAAIEGLGARLDGILRADKPASDGGIRDSAAYSILAAEWPPVRERIRASLEFWR
jgi:RimJ/RimL family protein N-acetyltransferase